MNNRKIGVLVSGRGSNLQKIMDGIAAGTLPLTIGVVISDKADAYALTRAQQAGIAQVAIVRKECQDKAEFESKIDAALREHQVELVVLAGFLVVILFPNGNSKLLIFIRHYYPVLPVWTHKDRLGVMAPKWLAVLYIL
ncbi:MAG: formyltransferase family protein [Acidaminococcaceae bacterium]